MKFYNVTASAIPGAKVNQIAITSSEYVYGCATIGNTQCCGSVEIWRWEYRVLFSFRTAGV